MQALIEAAQAEDRQPVLKVLGEDAKPLIDSGDPVADKNGREEFRRGLQGSAFARQERRGRDHARSRRGQMALPHSRSSKGDGGWHFDSAAGAEELINRRVGENELATIQSCLAYVDAQREYYMRNPQKDPLLHYANKLISTEGKKDGLYWPAGANEEQSPLGEEFARGARGGLPAEGRHDEGRAVPWLHLPHADRSRGRTLQAAPMTTWSTTSC